MLSFHTVELRAQVWNSIWPRISALIRGKKKTETATAVVEKLSSVLGNKVLSNRLDSLMQPVAEGNASKLGLTFDEHQHKNAKVVNRQSVRTMLPTWRSVLFSMHKKLTVVEPTYKDIVTLYRCVITLCPQAVPHISMYLAYILRCLMLTRL